jgi:hypothetical protein
MINNTVSGTFAQAPDVASNSLDQISGELQAEQSVAIEQPAAMLPVEDQATRNAKANFSPGSLNKAASVYGTPAQRNYATDPANRQAIV